MSSRLAIFFSVALALLLVVLGIRGCGHSVYPVEGVVLLDGEPLAGAIVTFQPDGEGPIGLGNTAEDGRFSVVTAAGDGLMAGDFRVILSRVTGSIPDTMPPWAGRGVGAVEVTQAEIDAWNAERAELAKDQREWVPEKYRTAITTPFHVTVPVTEDVRLEMSSTESTTGEE